MLRQCKVFDSHGTPSTELTIIFVCFINISLCSFCSGVMKWSEMHDLYLCREVLFIKPYQFKPGSACSGNAWTSIANDLCAVEELCFTVNQKSVRDRYRLLIDKHKKKMRAQESESGSTTDETELDQLLQNILEETEEALSTYDKETKEKQDKELLDRKRAEEVRQKALESLGQTQKRHVEENDDCQRKKRPRKNGNETMMYLQNKAEREFDLRKEEMQLKRQEMEFQKEMQLEAIRKQNSTTQNVEKLFEHFQTQQLNLQQQLMQQQQQYQQMQMKQAQQQQQMMQQQSQLVFTLLEKMSKN